MEYTNPGYAATQALEQFIVNRDALARQARLDQLKEQQMQIELEDRQRKIEQETKDRDRKNVEEQVAGLVPGDVPDADLMANAKRVGIPLATKFQPGQGEQLPGPVPEGQPVLREDDARVYVGSPQYRMQQLALQQTQSLAAKKAAALSAVDHTKPETFDAAMQAGATPAEIKSVIESRNYTDPNAPVPIVRIGRNGQLETLGTAPKNAHFQNEPAPVNVNVGQGGMDGLSDAALSFMAEQRLAGGPEPAFGSGTQGAVARQKFYTKLAEVAAARGLTGADLARLTAQYKADTGSLTAIQKNSDAVNAFMSAADANAGPGGLDALLSKVPDSGFATVNKVWRPIRGNLTDEAQQNMSAFKAYINSLKNEYARITSQPNLAGQLTDTARKEMEVIINDDSTIPQIKGALNALRNEGKNRESAFQTQINTIGNRIGGNKDAAPKKPTAEELLQKYGAK